MQIQSICIACCLEVLTRIDFRVSFESVLARVVSVSRVFASAPVRSTMISSLSQHSVRRINTNDSISSLFMHDVTNSEDTSA